MTFLRHASRHVHHSVAAHIESGLAQLNWTDPAATPFGAPAVTFQRTAAPASRDAGLTAGLVTITLGDEYNPQVEELGGPLSSQEYPIFIDVFQDADATALALATDIKDILLGRFEFASRFIDVKDQATQTVVPGWKVEFDDVVRVRPDSTYQLFWQVVKVTAVTHFNEVSY